MQIKVFFILLFLNGVCFAGSAHKYYLDWNSDDTERGIRPVYPIASDKIENFQVYQIELAKNNKPKQVCFFHYGKPSNRSDFGANCLRFKYGENFIQRTYYNTNGERVENGNGIFTERYILNGKGFYTKKIHLNKDGQPDEDSNQVAEVHYKRDGKGRSISAIQYSLNGNVVPELNGFYEARFEFDENDYAIYRKGFDKNGEPMEGEWGYNSANFWFDENGTFLKEEFRNIKGDLVEVPGRGYARIVFKDIDVYGNWRKVVLYDKEEKILSESAGVIKVTYDDKNRRKDLRYFDKNSKPSQNHMGISKYVYVYDELGYLKDKQAYSLDGKLIKKQQ